MTDTPDTEAKRKRKASLPQSDVPTHPLAEAIRVPRALADHLAKEPSTPLQVAAAIGIKPTTGLFRSLTGAAVAFGVTDGGSNAKQIALTELGRRIVAPLVEGDDAVAAREATLVPRVTREFLDKYDGSKWPKDDIAANVVEAMGVPADQAERAVARIREDAIAAGFITEINGDDFVALNAAVWRLEAPRSLDEDHLIEVPPIPRSALEQTTTPEPPLAQPSAPESENRRVFITHGKDTAIVHQLKEILSFGDFIPVVSIENQTAAKPVPDKVMDDMRSCGAGIVHVGSEMRLLDADGTEHQMLNPNVLIEIGAAMALYGRKFILLVKKGTQLPSNLQGLYEVRYEGSGLDHEATMNLLKAFNSFKDSPASTAA